MRVGFVEGVLPVMFFMFLFNVSSFPLMFYVLYVLVFFWSLTFLGLSV